MTVPPEFYDDIILALAALLTAAATAFATITGAGIVFWLRFRAGRRNEWKAILDAVNVELQSCRDNTTRLEMRLQHQDAEIRELQEELKTLARWLPKRRDDTDLSRSPAG